MVLIRKAGGLLGAGDECGLGWPRKTLSGVLLEGREVRLVGFKLEADEQWDKLVLGHGWRVLVHLASFLWCPQPRQRGHLGSTRSASQISRAIHWNLSEVKILRLEPRTY